jgi:transposase
MYENIWRPPKQMKDPRYWNLMRTAYEKKKKGKFISQWAATKILEVLKLTLQKNCKEC